MVKAHADDGHGVPRCRDELGDDNRQLIIQEGWKYCPREGCKVIVDKTEACDHLTCPNCQANFCYQCGKWLPAPLFQCPCGCGGGAPPFIDDEEEDEEDFEEDRRLQLVEFEGLLTEGFCAKNLDETSSTRSEYGDESESGTRRDTQIGDSRPSGDDKDDSDINTETLSRQSGNGENAENFLIRLFRGLSLGQLRSFLSDHAETRSLSRRW